MALRLGRTRRKVRNSGRKTGTSDREDTGPAPRYHDGKVQGWERESSTGVRVLHFDDHCLMVERGDYDGRVESTRASSSGSSSLLVWATSGDLIVAVRLLDPTGVQQPARVQTDLA